MSGWVVYLGFDVAHRRFKVHVTVRLDDASRVPRLDFSDLGEVGGWVGGWVAGRAFLYTGR